MYYDLLHLVYLHRSPRTPVLVPAKSLRTPQNVINVACISNLVKSIQAFCKCKSHRFLASANFEEKKSNYFWLTINGTFSGSVRRLLAGTSTCDMAYNPSF